jgi:excisionase family DNA binding protein
VASNNEGAKAVSVERVSGDPEPECLSLREASRFLGVCVRTVRREIERGRLPAFRVGCRSLRIRMSELRRYMEREPVGVQHV